MSMFVSVVRATPTAFELVKKNPAQLDAVFFEGDPAIAQRLGIADDDSSGFDYISADMTLEAIDEADGETDDDPDDDDDDDDDDDEVADDRVSRELGADGTLDYDAGYGSAFTLDRPR